MKCNVGKADRIFRVVAGLSIIAAGIYFKSWFGIIGVVPLVTASLRWCPLYIPFGFSSGK
ncbi:MAG: DUF2892 domain-containing protein [Pseudomonadales bacterium]|nr:DUF2892 domain-containing protein [Pseudomonadales bacterium]MCP5172922.1 DUF2892 domain-containing protein [Pseudomonadales bacterium]MCP5302395.1 DUF2892 domain-containing protein [Pseudomonadales bacterium]